MFFRKIIKNIEAIKIYFLIICLGQSIKAQTFPREYFKSKAIKISYDSGDNWEFLSSFGSNRYQQINKDEFKSNSNFLVSNFSIVSLNENLALSNFSILNYKKNFYAYISPFFFTNSEIKNKFSNLYEKNFIRLFEPVNKDQSGIGYKNEWLLFQIGRGRESWGAGSDIQLALSENSNDYDYFLLFSDYGNIRVNYIHGFLETTLDDFNRYITARGIEWTNKKFLVIGLSEIVIYSGRVLEYQEVSHLKDRTELTRYLKATTYNLKHENN